MLIGLMGLGVFAVLALLAGQASRGGARREDQNSLQVRDVFPARQSWMRPTRSMPAP